MSRTVAEAGWFSFVIMLGLTRSDMVLKLILSPQEVTICLSISIIFTVAV